MFLDKNPQRPYVWFDLKQTFDDIFTYDLAQFKQNAKNLFWVQQY